MTGYGAIYRALFSWLIISLKLRDKSLHYRMWDLSKKDEREDIIIKQLEILFVLSLLQAAAPKQESARRSN
ncbi:hypothetical protein QMZ65_22105 [Pantoea sp. EABMAA-21]|uniref:hypothetical protein n=1 Tax=unclassified Pantoea TaxID=2630326 RepID=UPI000BDDC21D|nr:MULTISPECIES: hypothetical protein [unclassified Pantoea]MDI9279917.1 hypothetical protein [Pantoea sp. EABMAA-21]SNY55283.1 hypothetical protein SAMN02744778_00364 [Pantoea sp. GL120224-02]